MLWYTLLTWENLDRGTADVHAPGLKTALFSDSTIVGKEDMHLLIVVGKALSLPAALLTDASSLKKHYIVCKHCV